MSKAVSAERYIFLFHLFEYRLILSIPKQSGSKVHGLFCFTMFIKVGVKFGVIDGVQILRHTESLF